jgi:hypothetical protein
MADTSRKTGHEVNVAYEKPVFTFSERTVLTEDLEATLDDLLGGLL